jgi:hypothetical protein
MTTESQITNRKPAQAGLVREQNTNPDATLPAVPCGFSFPSFGGVQSDRFD